jgi:hypothetical protein
MAHVMITLSKPSPATKQRHASRLKQAVASPSAANTGVTMAWYDDASHGISSLTSTASRALALGVVYLGVRVAPNSLADAAWQSLQTGWEYLLDNYTHKQLFVWGIFSIFTGLFWVRHLPLI